MIKLTAENRKILENEYSYDDWNKESGLSVDELKTACENIDKQRIGVSRTEVKAEMIEYILENAQISVNPLGVFADKINHGGIMRAMSENRKVQVDENEMKPILDDCNDLQECRAISAMPDFGHTCPDWEFILDNGIVGILNILEEKSKQDGLSEKQKQFYNSSVRVYRAILNCLKRFADEAESKIGESENMELLAKSLRNLTHSAPQTMHEAMQLITFHYELQQHIDSVFVRSLGKLDVLLYKYYKSDLENNVMTESEERELIKYFYTKLIAKQIPENIPFRLCGSDIDGNDLTNPLSFVLLEEYIAFDTKDPKIHICYHKNLDSRIIDMVMRSIRDGKNSFIFMNDEVTVKALEKIGIETEDAHDYAVVGCYEPCANRKEIPCTCAGRVNIPKAIELVFTDGVDMMTGKRLTSPWGKKITDFNDFMSSFYQKLEYLSNRSMELVNEYERNFMNINPSLVFSPSFEESVKRGINVYDGGAKYNNSSVCGFGLATAVDSLAAVKKAVFDDGVLSLDEFGEILKNNWKDNEVLRLKIKNTYPKYGNGDAVADAFACEVNAKLGGFINGKPNARNGVYRLGTFSIDWIWEFGEHTAATPDGRTEGEVMSKNMSAVVGCDKSGITSLINSVTKVDFADVPNGTILDLTLHESSARGEEGLNALKGVVTAYMNMGGIAVHINILSPEKLRKAQQEPDKYKTLQVRLCGWNVYFVNLSKREQEQFIKQTEHALSY